MRTVTIANRYRGLKVDRAELVAIVGALDDASRLYRGGCPPGELSVAFLGDAALADLHGRFLDDPSTTDVITFEGDPALNLAGEICVSVDTAMRFAKQHGRRWQDELLLYVIHGWLHLAGYDDLQPNLKRIMRRAEARAMQLATRQSTKALFALRNRPRHLLK